MFDEMVREAARLAWISSNVNVVFCMHAPKYIFRILDKF